MFHVKHPRSGDMFHVKQCMGVDVGRRPFLLDDPVVTSIEVRRIRVELANPGATRADAA